MIPILTDGTIELDHAGGNDVAAVVRLQHVSIPIPADGHADARRFFGETLGMREVPQPSTLAHNSVVWFDASGDGQEVHCFVDEPYRPGCADQHLCLQVDDLAEMRSQLQQHDVEPEETIVIRNRPRFFVSDPFGNKIELVQVDGQHD